MEYQEVEKILNRKVFFIRESTSKEKQAFSDKKEGGFFTLGLESGQIFASHFSEKNSGLKRRRILTFRPINHVLKGLEEVSYDIPVYTIGDFFYGGPQEAFKFATDCPKKDKELMMDLLEFARPGDMTFEHSENLPFLDKSLQVAKAYFEKIHAADHLKKMLIPETKQVSASVRKTKSTKSR